MKKYYITIFFLFSIFYTLLGQNQVNYLSSDKRTITLRVVAYAKKSDQAIESAKLSAVKEILFRGIPGSQQIDPLIGINEENIMNSHKKYFNEFIDNKRYNSFILSSIPITEFKKDLTKRKSITMDVCVNIKALRTDLEQQGIIRKFGL